MRARAARAHPVGMEQPKTVAQRVVIAAFGALIALAGISSAARSEGALQFVYLAGVLASFALFHEAMPLSWRTGRTMRGLRGFVGGLAKFVAVLVGLAMGAAILVGLAWLAVSAIKWLWHHPLF